MTTFNLELSECKAHALLSVLTLAHDLLLGLGVVRERLLTLAENATSVTLPASETDDFIVPMDVDEDTQIEAQRSQGSTTRHV